ncbi:acetyltransferase (GNAT) family protein [Aneurinibacillus soli]|uniref:Uncharacterized protein n=1 Tax=Aneurinibacillus soli TaxID=1500254 RepID=A0A0U5AZM7_9BACL|nr:GNAT family N-acetyltransferase [Aneurinibacillus soli]PYE63339.1 acetyltransferase (GNAT) family protein [Aneurinibacillus soli]BAU27730.1 hypothetical protein CB4_01904 [Aneurinibacillus soli]
MIESIRLYDYTNIQELPWERMRDGAYAKAYILPLMKYGACTYISNVQTTVLALTVGDIVMPVTVNGAEYDNSYVCSPYTHYVSYAEEELAMLKSPLLEKTLRLLLCGVGSAMRASRVNKIVYVNNWLLSTNLYEAESARYASEIVEFLVERFPNHIIAFRSLNRKLYADWCVKLEACGCLLVGSRYVYVFDPQTISAMPSRVRNTLRRDAKQRVRHGYEVVRSDEMTIGNMERLVELYRELYIDKYSVHNPQFTPDFLEQARRTGILTLIGLHRAGQIEGVLGYFQRGGVMTTPVFGYNMSLPKETGLYRMLSSVLVEEAAANGLLLHQSAGVGAFKADRGADGVREYTAVYMNHLPRSRRLIWHILAMLIERIGFPLVEKYKL